MAGAGEPSRTLAAALLRWVVASDGLNLGRHLLVEQLEVVDAEFVITGSRVASARMTCTFVVSPASLNAGNALFGGLVGSLCDALTTVLHMSAGLLGGQLHNSVSVGLQTEFLAGAELGDRVLARVVVDRMGRDFVFTGCDFHLDDDGRLLYRSRHQKKVVASVDLEHLPPQLQEELGRARAALALPAQSARL